MKTDDKTLIEALNILADEIKSPDGVPSACLREAANRLHKLTTWISVDNNLPCEGEVVLALWSDGEQEVSEYYDGQIGWANPVASLIITHWRYLPEVKL